MWRGIMIKLLLAILGLYKIKVKSPTGKILKLDITKADVLKDMYFQHANRYTCFCGGKIVKYKSINKLYNANSKIVECKQCKHRYIPRWS
jgi:hypothetical protein